MAQKTALKAYLASPLMALVVFTAASLVFALIIKDPSPIPVFVMFGVIQITCMILFALLPRKGKKIAQSVSMLLIGSFLFLMVGILSRNDIQLEGFFFYLTTGTLSGALVHFSMAKIIGPLLYGRNWCAWGCWTGMILNLLPYSSNTSWKKGLSKLRIIHFALSLMIMVILYFGLKISIITTDPEVLKSGIGTTTELTWFIAGNLIYYLVGIILAVWMKDNRAFCKYICPVTVLLKLSSRFSLLRISGNKALCNNCQICISNCPMSIAIPEYIKDNKRVKSTECIMCMNCVAKCPNSALRVSVGFDIATNERLHQQLLFTELPGPDSHSIRKTISKV